MATEQLQNEPTIAEQAEDYNEEEDQNSPDLNDLLAFKFPERPASPSSQRDSCCDPNEEEEGEWFVFHLYDRPPRFPPDVPTLAPQQKPDECRLHHGMVVRYVCTEPVCSGVAYCNKCRGDHNNHTGLSIDQVQKAMKDNLERNETEITLKSELIGKLDALGKPFEAALMKVADVVEGLVCDSELVKAQTSIVRRKCLCLVQCYAKMNGKCKDKIVRLTRNSALIKKAQGVGNREVFKQFMRIRHTFDRCKDEYEERTIEKITALINQLAKAEDMLKEDAVAISIEFDEIEEKVLLAHLNSIDQELVRMNRVLWECAGNTQVSVPARRYVAGCNEQYLTVFDYRFRELYEIPVPDAYGARVDSYAYAMAGSSMFFSGGFCEQESCSVSVLFEINIYDLKVVDRPDMIAARSMHALVPVMDKWLFAIGGKGKGPLALCEMFTLQTNCWCFIPSLPESLVSPMTQVFNERYIYVFAKHTAGAAYLLDTCDLEGGWSIPVIQDPFKHLRNCDLVEVCQTSPSYIDFFTSRQTMLQVDIGKYTAYRRSVHVGTPISTMCKTVAIGGRLFYVHSNEASYVDLKQLECRDLYARVYKYSLQ